LKLKQIAEGESGYALPIALASILVFTIIFGTYILLLNQELKTNVNLVNGWQAKYIAESGFENAIYNSKIALQNAGNRYLVDLSTTYFNADGTPKLLPADDQSKNSSDTQIKSSGVGTVKDKNQTAIGEYTWVIKYQAPTTNGELAGTVPATPQTPPPEQLTNTLTIECVGVYHYRVGPSTQDVRSRVRAVITEKFVPGLIPDTPVQVKVISYAEVPTRFSWEN
jgi:hypothetical protein